MPELPEVEYARQQVSPFLRRRVQEVYVADSRMWKTNAAQARIALIRKTLVDTHRHGKHLFLKFSGGMGAYVHLGMSGRWVMDQTPWPKHTHLGLVFGKGDRFGLVAPRRFGRVAVDGWGPLLETWTGALGPDFLDRRVTVAWWRGQLSATSRPIKKLLMDQSFVAGLGNIQAIEGLFAAGLDPRRPSNGLGSEEADALRRELRRIARVTLRQLQEHGGKYVNEGGPNLFRIYGKTGAACPQCGRKIEQMSIEQRTTHYCRCCQR